MRQFRLNAILRLHLPVLALSIAQVLAAQSSLQPPAASQPAKPAPDAKPAPITNTEQVTVTAYRAPLGVLESPVTTRLLSGQQLRSTAAITFDDQLRQLPGVELFRRSSSLVANPTSQGISLRALGSTSASRTLVTEDDVPLNDPLGGWIHWQEQPELSIKDVELVRGGVSDLYGSSAIGGVVNIIPVRPSSNGLEVQSTFGGEGTYDNSLMATAHHVPWNFLAAGGLIGTDGYIQESPSQRGPVDVASNVHSQNALVFAGRDFANLKLFVRATGFDESRHNGTPYQINATRLIRYSTGADWQNARSAALALRFYGSDERYRQTFSSISNLPNFGDPACTYRCGETPSKFSYVPDNELGAAAHWSQPFGAGLLLVVGGDAHDVRVWDREKSYTGAAALTNLADHQRDWAAYAEVMWEHKAWTLVASSRMDWFQNYDGHETQWNGSTWFPTAAQPPQRDERIFDPRLGLSRKLSPHWALTASGFRAFRAPTPSELYRSTQVGNQLTLPNGSLLSERATGWEAGIAAERSWGSIRTSYFLTEVNRPIAAFTTNPSSSPILLMRENLGQIESRGISLDYELHPRSWLAVDGGYQYAYAVVSRGTQDLNKWIPEVARNLATLNLRASRASIGTLSLQSRLSGRQFDDDANANLLYGYFRLDAYASHTFTKRTFGSQFELFAAGENLFNRSIEVSKTPTTTLGQPRTARAGFMIHMGRASE
jgi:outer membrane receptor protein involved in Fe transport